MKKTISVIVPVYNEEDVLGTFHLRMNEVFNQLSTYDFELIFVNDGSADRTAHVLSLLAETDPRISVLSLSRNFGKEAAMTAGLDHANGDAVAIFDVDLQDPPELLIAFVEKWEAGYDVAYGKRTHRHGESSLKKLTAHAFYRLLGRFSKVTIPKDTGDCRLMSRRVVLALRQVREQHRFMKGLFAWVGYPSVAIEYVRDPRSGGVTKFNYLKLWNFALEGITSFTDAPLKMATYLGMLISVVSFAFGFWIILKTILWGDVVRGYPSLVVIVLFLGGVQLLAIGVLGEYVGRIFGETKNRPLYLLAEYHPSSLHTPRSESSQPLP